MSTIHYKPVPTSLLPNVTLQECTAQGGGTKQMRLIFDYPILKDGLMYRIAIDTHCAVFTADKFPVMCDGEKRTVSINRSSIIKRLNVSERLYKKALVKKDLMRLILPFLFRYDSGALREYMRQMEGDLHLLKEDYKNLTQSINVHNDADDARPTIPTQPIPSGPGSTEVSENSDGSRAMTPSTRRRVKVRQAFRTLNRLALAEA